MQELLIQIAQVKLLIVVLSEGGSYYIRETKASKNYEISGQDRKSFEVQMGINYEMPFEDKPKGDPAGLKLYKNTYETDDNGTGTKNLKEGNIDYSEAVFSVTYYDTYTDDYSTGRTAVTDKMKTAEL